jgi:hypothetical protein
LIAAVFATLALQPQAALARQPAPLPQLAVLVPGPGADEAAMSYSRAAVAARRSHYGLAPSQVDPARFEGCFADADADADGAEDCVRERLKAARVEAGEVAIAVVVTRSPDGGVAFWTCLGGARANQYADPGAQHVNFGGTAAADDPRVQAVVDSCLGQAGNEYNIP